MVLETVLLKVNRILQIVWLGVKEKGKGVLMVQERRS